MRLQPVTIVEVDDDEIAGRVRRQLLMPGAVRDPAADSNRDAISAVTHGSNERAGLQVLDLTPDDIA